MQLTKLEIKGFKSFGDKITINFGEGITGIVGPNGCGKSNVVDAIRWVLGEQKISALRSEKLENIIFNGTKKRKATQLAEVSLSFNNTRNLLPVEYNQVTITRKFYRSGDSEYLLNGINCRLKDITNLFLDTGIAANSYAIIELAMVDDILTDKENSRRHLFEEAAGISKFKIRKKETLRKLGETDADLERVADLLFEIEKNMRSLERQARQAKKYFKIKEEYKELSISLAGKNIARFHASLNDINKQIDAENDRKTELNKRIADQEAKLEKAKAGLLQKEKLLASRQRALNDHVGKIRHFESEKKIKNERLKYLQDKSESLSEQIDQDKQSNQRAEFSIKGLTQEKESAEKIFREVEEKLLQLKTDLEEQRTRTNSLQDEVNTLDKIHRNKSDEFYQLKKDQEIKDIQLSSLKQELEKTTSDSSEKSANLAEFENKLKDVRSRIDEKKEKLEVLRKYETTNEQRIASTERTIEVIKEERTLVNRRLDAKRNEYSLTKSLVDNLEGFPEAIKFLKKKADWNKNAPLLSDIISCDDKYKVTIENYLEPYMNYYVVDKQEEAYKAINILSDAAKGKANFFILNKLERFHATDPRIYDNAIPATEIVEYDAKYSNLISYILDGVYIVPGHETSMPSDDDNVFITMNGKVTRRKYSLSGGAVGLFEGKRIGRLQNLEKLQLEIKRLQKKLDEIDKNLQDEQKSLETLRRQTKKEELQQLQQDMNLLNQELVTVETRQEQVNSLLSSNTVRKEDIQDKIDELQKEFNSLIPLIESSQVEIEDKSHKLLNFRQELTDNKELLELRSKAFNDENILFHQQQNKITSLIQEISFKQSNYDSSKERIEKNRHDLELNEQEIKRLLDSSEVQEDELVIMYDEKAKIEAGVNEAEKDYYAGRGDIDAMEKSIREIHHQRESVDELIMELRNTLNEVKIELSAIKERLAVEFDVDAGSIHEQGAQQEDADASEDELREKVDDLKSRLEKMGPINPMAMEAFDEIQERHQFITKQKDDLEQAKESLLTTIEEIDLVAKETFLSAFNKIKENFIRVFRSLFTDEDDCDLKLLEPNNPLDSKIEIIAKPKGKKPLTISQLSGGEKTLTATSLLFAIYLLKPAPFCIFDEVDAPLDDANIDKFNSIIRKFSQESQFIIVTHNKRTMSSTDIIYGITMVEQGVSRVVPVNLMDLE